MEGLLGAYGSEGEDEDAEAKIEDEELEPPSTLPLTPVAEELPEAGASPLIETAAPAVPSAQPLETSGAMAEDAGGGEALGTKPDPFWLPPELAQPLTQKCAADVQEKVREYITKQEETGNTITSSLKSLSGYKNPDFLQHCVKYDDINQYGSCYPPEIFDPANLPAEDYYDRLAYEWEERLTARRSSQRASQKNEFVSRGVEQARAMPGGLQGSATAAGMVAHAKAIALNRSSKWDTRR